MNVEGRKRKLKEGLCRDAETSSFRVVGLAVDDKGSVERWMGVRERVVISWREQHATFKVILHFISLHAF